MKIIWSNKIDDILKVGISLNDISVNNWALTKSQALEVLDQFLLHQIPVLGGDVFEKPEGEIQHNYANWYCDQRSGESRIDFVKRSIEKAKSYIENYKPGNSKEYYFTIVPEVD